MLNKDLRITLSGDDPRSVDHALRRIMDIVKDTGNEARGPIPLPPKAPARSCRTLDVIAPNHKFVPALTVLDLPSTVSVDVAA